LEERKLEKEDAEASEITELKERKTRVSKRPRTVKEDEEALKANVITKFEKGEE
jgi:hypothetical protein